jgi:hypothetical protein
MKSRVIQDDPNPEEHRTAGEALEERVEPGEPEKGAEDAGGLADAISEGAA